MGIIEWTALGLGATLVAYPVLQALGGRPELTFAFDRLKNEGGAALLVHIHDKPVDSAGMRLMGVTRDDVHFSVSVAVIDEQGKEILRYTEPLAGSGDPSAPDQFHLYGGQSPVTLRILACSSQAARIHTDPDPAAYRDLKPGSYLLRLTARYGQRDVLCQRGFVATQNPNDSYWADR